MLHSVSRRMPSTLPPGPAFAAVISFHAPSCSRRHAKLRVEADGNTHPSTEPVA